MSILVGSVIVTCVIACLGYVIYRNRKSPKPLDTLTLQDIFSWVDILFDKIEKESDTKYEVNILPNSDTKKLIKAKDERAYAAILQQEKGVEKKVISTKVFYANSLDRDLSSLNDNKIVVIPIE